MSKIPPKARLSLEWVYGYRGHQCHDNIFYNKDRKLVYFAAGLGIVYDTNAMKQQYYLEHNDDIICLTMASDYDTIATGQIGKEPYICVWSSLTLETKSFLKGHHTHGISSLAFSNNGKNLVSIGLDPNATMNVWDWKSGKVIATTRAHSDRVFDSRFVFAQSKDSIKLVTCGVKHIKFWTLSGNALSAKKGIFGKVGEIQTMFTVCTSRTDENISYSGTASGDIYVWKENTLSEVVASVHKGAVYSIQSEAEGYISGGKDGSVVCFDLSFRKMFSLNLLETSVGYEGLVVRSVCRMSNNIVIGSSNSDIIESTVSNSKQTRLLMSGHGNGELWGLATHSKKPIFATGSDDKHLKVWNLNDKVCINTVRLDTPIRSCGFSHDGSKLAIGLTTGHFKVLACRDMTEIFTAQHRKEVIHELKFSPNDNWLAVGSNDNFVDIYETKSGFKRKGTCKGNSSFITHLDWSADSTFIRTNSGAAEYLIFRAPDGEHVTQNEVISSIKWAESTGVLGNEIQGIWQKYSDTNDINAADVNFHARVIATGDDFGMVKLFQYPCPVKGTHFRKYIGHCAHVTNVRWSCDGRHLLSIGGADQSILQWKLQDAAGEVNGDVYQDDSISEGSDSGLSDINACDSELERENQVNYSRVINKEEASRIQEKEARDAHKNQKRKTAPTVGIELEWVHGYRGYDCRANLYYLQSGEVVYHVAAVGIVLTLAEDSNHNSSGKQRHYIGHTDDILCLALHPAKDFVATGEVGRDPTIHIWDANTMKVISILKGQHERGVCSVDFSNDGKKLASVGLDDNHTIVVWNWRRGEKLASTRGNKDKIFVIKWNPHNNDKLVAVGVRYIRFWTLAGTGFTSQRGTVGQVGKLETQLCAVYDPNIPGVCYTGSANGQVYVWKENMLDRTVAAHQNGGCYAIDAVVKGFVTGGKDGIVNLYNDNFTSILKSYKIDGENNKLLSTGTVPCIRAVILGKGKILVGTSSSNILVIKSDGQMNVIAHGHSEGELWGLAVHPHNLQCATVSDDSNLIVWNVSSGQHSVLQRTRLKGPARCCAYNYLGSAIAVGYKNGSFSVLSCDSFKELAAGHHRKEEISDIKFSPNPGKYLAVASHDNFVDLYSTNTHQRLSVCKGASSYITHIDWDSNGKLLMLNSGAKEQLFFEAPRGTRQTVSRGSMDSMKWDSWSCVLGTTCQGIWPPKCDVTDINASSLSHSGTVIATADDFGRVKLFEYPCPNKFAKYKLYNGHSAHVTNIRWLPNDRYLASVGGADTSLMIWRNKESIRSISTMNGHPHATEKTVQSDISDTDDEEENGYDSDVEREKNMDYSAKTYSSSVTEIQKEALKKQSKSVDKETKLKKEVSRAGGDKVAKVQSAAMRAKLNEKTTDSINGRVDVLDGDDSSTARRRARGSVVNNSTPPQIKLERVSQLELTHVHGYRGFDCRNNLHYLCSDNLQSGTGALAGGVRPGVDVNNGGGGGGGKSSNVVGNVLDSSPDDLIVYHAAAVGIVHQLSTGRQWFYTGHTDDILCLCTNRHPRYRGVVATGELGELPTVHIWRAGLENGTQLLSCIKNIHTHGICSVNFSSTGTVLLSVGIDPQHTIAVTRWEEGTILAKVSQQSQRIFLAEFRPDSDTTFVDVGVKHVKFWTVAGNQLVSKRGVIPPQFSDGNESVKSTAPVKMTTMLSVAFGMDEMTYTGAMSGDIWVWKGSTIQRIIRNVHTGPVFVLYTTLSDGLIVSGGKEKGKDTGSIKLWNHKMQRHKPFYLNEKFDYRGSSSNASNPLDEMSIEVIRSISRVKGKILVGTQDNDIIEVDENSGEMKYLMQSHGEGIVTSVAVHPCLPIYASASDNGSVKIWDLNTKMLIQNMTTGPATCIDFSPTGSYILIGLANGAFVILSAKSYRLLVRKKDRGQSITQCRFGPSSASDLVAITTEDKVVDIYRITKSRQTNSNNKTAGNNDNCSVTVQRIIYLKDIGGIVQHLDFSIDADYIRLGMTDLRVLIYALSTSSKNGSTDATSQLVTDIAAVKDKIIWETWTSIAGEEVKGIWPSSNNISSNSSNSRNDIVNVAVVSQAGNSVATGDDFGLVKIFPQFPVSANQQPSCICRGHSAHVTSARFVCDDSHLITAGGDDCCIFVWQCS